MFRGKICAIFASALLLGGCGEDALTRGTSGAGLGAGTALLMLGNPLLGAAAGAGLGAVTSQQQINLGPAPYSLGGYGGGYTGGYQSGYGGGYGYAPQPNFQYGYPAPQGGYGQYPAPSAPQPYGTQPYGYGAPTYPNYSGTTGYQNYAPPQAYCPAGGQFQQPYPATQFDAYGRPVCQTANYQRNNQGGVLSNSLLLLGAASRAGSLPF